jgi:hypothetical protein
VDLVKKHPILVSLAMLIVGALIGGQLARMKYEAKVASATKQIKDAAKALGLSAPDVAAALKALGVEEAK